jgi:hypothetical protein
MTGKIKFVARMWYYFRVGYGTYLTFLLGYVSTLVTLYYLAIKNMPDLLTVFPHFLDFIVVGTVFGVPISITIGWLHFKRAPTFTAEADIGIESNPYYYKLPPGYNREAFAPLYLELLVLLKRLLDSNSLLTDEDESQIADLEQKLHTLINGGYVGKPRIKIT